MSRKPCPTTGRGPIDAHAIYPLAVFLRRLGIGRPSLTALRRQGLPVHHVGQRVFIDGAEAIGALRQLWTADQAADQATGPVATEGTGDA
jgi:hypothetical protein